MKGLPRLATNTRILLLLTVLLSGALGSRAQVAPTQLPPTPNLPTPLPAPNRTAPVLPTPKANGRPRSIINDSTKLIYGPKTTKLLYEADALAGRSRLHPYDTAFHEMWNPRNWYHDTTFQQDLGNTGTASRAVTWPVGQPTGGIRWGRDAFSRYAWKLADIPYYNTRSPYSHLYYIQGGRGEQVFDVRYARNARRALNVGFAYQRLSANKQLASSAGAKDNLLNHAAPVFWLTYQTKDSVYQAFASYAHLYHEVLEQGGALYGPGLDPGRVFPYDTATVGLRFASNREFRNDWRLTQLLRLAGPGLQLFYTVERQVRATRFLDTNLKTAGGARQPSDSAFFAQTFLSDTLTQDRARFRLNQHTAGVLGGARFGSYRLYASRRDAAYVLYQGEPTIPATDPAAGQTRRVGRLAFGGEAQFRLRDVVAVTADGELQSGDNTYWLRATARYRFLSFTQLRNGYAPTLTQERFYGNHFQWSRPLNNTQRDESRVVLATALGRHRLTLDGALNRVRNFIYYGPDGTPQQETSTLTIGTVQGRYRTNLGAFFVDTRATVTVRPGRAAEVYRAPPVVADVLLYYQGNLFRQALFGQIGLDIYGQSDTRALAWQPATGQFYVPAPGTVGDARLRAYPVVDAFAAVDISSVNIFLKIANAAQGLPRAGYATTAGYPGLRRGFTFGLKWTFFD